MFGSTVVVEWRGRPLRAFVPNRLDDLGAPSAAAVRAAALAEGALRTVGDRLDGGLEVPARLLLRAEGVASSRIEQIEAPIADVAVADAVAESALSPGRAGGPAGGAAGWVADNLRAIDAALAHEGPLGVDELCGWHRVLMAHAEFDPGLVGAWRDRIGWIGGFEPRTAAYVPPPPELIGALMDDLVSYINHPSADPVVQAAVAHAQFESIHPFADGNGRIGRILIGWMLARRLDLRVPPPVSATFLRDRGGYLSGLTRYRNEGPEPWVRWFAAALDHTARSTDALLSALRAVAAEWPGRLTGVRADAAARRLLPHLIAHPALDVGGAAALVGTSDQAARAALTELAARGVLREVAPNVTGRRGRPARWWVAGELLDLLAGQ